MSDFALRGLSLSKKHHSVAVSGAFPETKVEKCIRDMLDIQHAAQQVLRPSAASACEPEVDSLVVVEIICAIEALLGMSLPTSFTPRGGYDGVEACVSDLLSETRAVWVELSKEVEAEDV